MEPTPPPITQQLTDVVGLRFSGIFPKGNEPSTASLRNWAKLRHIPYHKVGHFVYFDPAEVAAHIRSKLRVPPNELDSAVVFRQQPSASHGVTARILPRWSSAGRKPFKILNFKNPCGAISYRVSGHLHGVRIRRNFKTIAEAEAERQCLEIQRVDVTNKFRTVVTRLTDEQVREAETAFQLIGEKSSHSLLFFLEHALAHHAKAGYRKPLSEAVTEYMTAKKKEHERTIISDAQLVTVDRAMVRFSEHFPEQPVSQFDGEQLLPFLERGHPSLKTYNNRRSLAFNFFKYAVRHCWIAENPVEKTPYYRIAHRRGSAKTINATRAAELMGFLESFEGGALVPYFALCLFAGVRPCFRWGEMSRLQPESVMLDTGVIHIEPSVSKVKTKRTVTIQPNLTEWLSLYPLSRFPLLPANLVNTHRGVFEKFELTHDILRHTFISMFVGKFRSVGEAALQAGNSEEVVRKFYLDLKSPAEADRFFSIRPKAKADLLALL